MRPNCPCCLCKTFLQHVGFMQGPLGSRFSGYCRVPLGSWFSGFRRVPLGSRFSGFRRVLLGSRFACFRRVPLGSRFSGFCGVPLGSHQGPGSRFSGMPKFKYYFLRKLVLLKEFFKKLLYMVKSPFKVYQHLKNVIQKYFKDLTTLCEGFSRS